MELASASLRSAFTASPSWGARTARPVVPLSRAFARLANYESDIDELIFFSFANTNFVRKFYEHLKKI